MCSNPPGYMAAYIAQERQKIVSLLGGVCCVCKARDNIEIHHKNGKLRRLRRDKAGGTYGWDRLKEWRVSLKADNIELQCAICHKEYHLIHGRKTQL